MRYLFLLLPSILLSQAISSPNDVADLKIWLEASSLSLSDSTKVGTAGEEWRNNANVDDDLYCTGTDPNVPYFRTGIINSLPALHYDETVDTAWLILQDSSGAATVKTKTKFLHTSDNTVFILFTYENHNGGTTNGPLYDNHQENNTNIGVSTVVDWTFATGRGRIIRRASNGAAVLSTPTDVDTLYNDDWTLSVTRVDYDVSGNDDTLRVTSYDSLDATISYASEKLAAQGTSDPMNQLHIGASSNSGARKAYGGYLALILMYDRALNNTEVGNVTEWINCRYGFPDCSSGGGERRRGLLR